MALRTGDENGPTTELGAVNPDAHGLSWSSFVDEHEYAPDLKWPNSVSVYERMMTDAQVASLLRAVTLPIRRYRWMIDPNDADPSSVKALAEDLDLPIQGQESDTTARKRSRGRFSFDQHLNVALKALAYGHYYFEQVGEIGEDGLWHLKKLAERAPRTIGQIEVEKDGGLKWVKQLLGAETPEIPVSRLVCYVWDYESGNWVGRSMLRPLYRNWLIKDRLLRVDAIKHERHGTGIPIVKAPPGASREQIEQLDALARASKTTETGGGAIPSGAEFQLVGTQGSVPDTVESIRFNNEEMAGAFLAMFKQLGQTQTGSRALGDSFIDFFSLALMAVGDWVADVFNQHVVEDWYDFNYGLDSQPALLVYEPTKPELGAADLKLLIDSGAIQVDPAVETELRQRYNLPEREEPAPEAPSPVEPAPPEGGVTAAAGDAAVAPSLPLPDRPLRRQPYDHEITAAVDFAAIDASMTSAVDQLVTKVNALKKSQINELHDLIIAADGDFAKLSEMQATPVAEAAITDSMAKSAQLGVTTASAEAKAQGAAGTKPKISELKPQLANRAQATDQLLARALSETASRNAIRRTAPTVSPKDVAAAVKDHLLGLSDTYLHDQLNGALNGAMNTGRKAVMDKNDPTNIYASELLDDATCENCVSIDGSQYGSMQDAEGDYPTGGFGECLGGERCRGTLVAVYKEDG